MAHRAGTAERPATPNIPPDSRFQTLSNGVWITPIGWVDRTPSPCPAHHQSPHTGRSFAPIAVISFAPSFYMPTHTMFSCPGCQHACTKTEVAYATCGCSLFLADAALEITFILRHTSALPPILYPYSTSPFIFVIGPRMDSIAPYQLSPPFPATCPP